MQYVYVNDAFQQGGTYRIIRSLMSQDQMDTGEYAVPHVSLDLSERVNPIQVIIHHSHMLPVDRDRKSVV